MKKRKLNQRRYRQGEEPAQREATKPTEFPDETMLEHIREMVSMIEGRRVTLEEARALVKQRMEKMKKRETTPP